jgi:hypothetical protein
MSNDTDELIVETPETPVETEVETAAAPAEKPPVRVAPEDGIKKLQDQLASETAARQAAEARAHEAATAEAAARAQTQAGQLDLVKSAISRMGEAQDALETSYAEAMAAQDWKGAARAQRQMADNAAKLQQLETAKTNLETAPKPVPRAPADPVEAFASRLTPQSAAWVRSHPEFVREPLKHKQMIAAHELAVARGLTADTPEYFASVEKTLDIMPAKAPVVAPPATDDPPESAAAKPAEVAPPAAPVRNGSAGRASTIRLTAQEAEMARLTYPDSPDPLKEYALAKQALVKEGKLS